MSDDQRPGHRPDDHPDPDSRAPHRGWGGEYDSDATAFIEFPPAGHPETPGEEPLAAPGHGYQPPDLDRPAEPLSTPGATTDPGATGQWTMPFAYGGAPGHGADPASAPGPPPGPGGLGDTPMHQAGPGGQGGGAAAMSQGAAAFGGAGRGRTARRPLSTGRAAGPEAPPAAPEPVSDWQAPPGGEPAAAAPDGLAPGPTRAWQVPPGGGPAVPGPSIGEDAEAEPVTGWPGGAPGTEAGAAEPWPGAAEGDQGWQGEGGASPGEGPASAARDAGSASEPAAESGPASGSDAADPAARTDVAADPAGGPVVAPSRSDHPEASYVLRVNGVDRPVSGAWIGESLLYVLRERLGLAGAKDGCSQGECGACSVQVDGRLVAACLVPAATVAGSEIRTVEGLSTDGVPSDVQRALAASTAVQCGFCLPGMAMTVHELLEGNHAPSELETREALSGNLCRCTGYRGVLEAVRAVAGERAALAAPTDGKGPAPAAPEQPSAAGRIPHQAGPSSGDMP